MEVDDRMNSLLFAITGEVHKVPLCSVDATEISARQEKWLEHT